MTDQPILQEGIGGVDVRLPPSVHPGAVTQFHATEVDAKAGKRVMVPDDAIDALASALTFGQESARVILQTHDALAADPTKTADARAMLSRDAALRVLTNSAARLDKARAIAVATLQKLESETSTPPPPKDATELAIMQTIIQKLGAMDEQSRKAAVMRLDIPTARALLLSPAWLTNTLESELPLIRASFRQRYHGPIFLRCERLKRAIAAYDSSAETLVTWANKLTDRHAVEIARNAAENSARALEAAAIQGGRA